MKSLNGNAGFTLVELLVSLALLSLMAIYALHAFGTLRIMNRVESELNAQMEVDAVARLLRKELADARAAFQQTGNQQAKLYFVGRPSFLAYVTSSNGERETGGLYLVTLSLDETGSLTAKRQLLGATPNTHIDQVMLLRGVSSLNFQYAGAANPKEWKQDWQVEDQLPAAVNVMIAFPKADKRQWADLIIRLQTTN